MAFLTPVCLKGLGMIVLNLHHSMFHYTQADVTNTAVPSLAPTRVLGFSIWFDWFTGTDPGLKQAKGAPS